ncbi:hypothetical protein CEXT_234321 [Caerostris extrusa]|uniref:Uncharacterized protein n=1 Tax=Caerostris extrusa TaxID=172846 RepID=A0AAV4QWI8_CAEEX|nr:hypothetical protein CEXT_234321 [Caerostris extrusa]
MVLSSGRRLKWFPISKCDQFASHILTIGLRNVRKGFAKCHWNLHCSEKKKKKNRSRFGFSLHHRRRCVSETESGGNRP